MLLNVFANGHTKTPFFTEYCTAAS